MTPTPPARAAHASAPRRKWGWSWLSGGAAAWIVASWLVGSAAGVGAYTFYYAQGASYLSNDPQACVNCHIMQEQFDAWEKSSHKHVAVCNDCHAPHDSLAGKLYCKGRNGFFHSLAFTTGIHPDPIQITDYNRRITEAACRSCHSDIVDMIDSHALSTSSGDRLDCLRCHSNVGHWTH